VGASPRGSKMNVYITSEIEESIEMYWKRIKEIADKKDESQIDQLRLNVTLLIQYIARKRAILDVRQTNLG